MADTDPRYYALVWRDPARTASALPNPELHVWPTHEARAAALRGFAGDPMRLRRPMVAINAYPKRFADIPARYWQRLAARSMGGARG